MKKGILTALCALCLLIASAVPALAETQLDRIEKGVLAIQGDTQSLVSALGVIAEGTLPPGKGLIAYANEVGWNPWVIAAHNNLKADQLDKLPAGLKLNHPTTPAEMRAALKKARELRAEYYSSHQPNIRVKKIQADEMRVNQAIIDRLETKVAQIQTATVNQLNAELAQIKKAIIGQAKIGQAEVDQLNVKVANIEKAIIKLAQIQTANIQTANINQLNAELAIIKKALIDLAKIKRADVGQLNAELAKIKQAIINKAEIGQADVAKLNAKINALGQKIKTSNLKDGDIQKIMAELVAIRQELKDKADKDDVAKILAAIARIQIHPVVNMGGCPKGANCVQPTYWPAKTQWGFFAPKFDLVDIEDAKKPRGAVASKIQVFLGRKGARVQVVRYNGFADQKKYNEAIDRANRLYLRLGEFEGKEPSTCEYLLH